MAKSDSKAQRKSSLSYCTWLERRVWILNLEAEIPNAFRELGVHFIIYFLYILIFFSYIYTLSFFSLFSLLFFYTHIFYFTPLEV
jgi:hypothetical protein